MTRGLVIGKFYPPHKGHKLLIDTAVARAGHVDVIICEHPSQTIRGDLRARWLREIHPQISVRIVEDFGDDENSARWAKTVRELLGYSLDIVFTSEDYGDAFAYFLGAQHVMVDRDQLAVPVSGTMIRCAPLQSWEYLEPCVRAHFAKRVCVVGAESTGTTTVAQALAEHYSTVWLPEYGRQYTAEKLTASGAPGPSCTWESEDFEIIARRHLDEEDRLAREANRLLICDTDAMATAIWHERYMGTRSAVVEALAATRKYDLYLLTDCDIPFVQDGMRDGEHIRQWMTGRFCEELEAKRARWVWLRGSREARRAAAVKAVDELLQESGWDSHIASAGRESQPFN